MNDPNRGRSSAAPGARSFIAPPVLALVAALACSAAAAADDAPPGPPGDVRATLYDGAGGELFWERAGDDVGVVGYEVRVNGMARGVRDATSLYDPSLRPGTGYTFTVVAVDTAGQRSAPATATLGGGAGPVDPVDAGTAPPRPANLRGTVYSATAAELFWDRPATPNGFRPTWRISRDGVRVATTIGPSRFLDGLVAGRDHRFEIVALGENGRESAAAVAIVRTGPGGGVSVSDPDDSPPAEADARPEIRPAQPRIEVYSATAAELFWTPQGRERPRITANEIRRDGVLIDTVEGEFLRSYFDDSREPGRAYEYTITALSRIGNASATVSDDGFRPGGSMPSGPADALPDGTLAALGTVFDLINATALERVAAAALRLDERYTRNDVLALEPLPGGSDAPFARSRPYACPDGGTIDDIRQYDNDGSAFDASGCTIGPVTIDGELYVNFDTLSAPDGTERPVTRFYLQDIELRDATDGVRIAFGLGTLGVTDDPEYPLYWRVTDLSVGTPTGRYAAASLSGGNADERARLPDGSLGLTVDGRGVELGGPSDADRSVRTLGPFEFGRGRAGGAPTVGRLSVEAGESRWLIDAFDGNPETFTFTSTVDGVAVSATLAWSDRYRVTTVSPVGIDPGF